MFFAAREAARREAREKRYRKSFAIGLEEGRREGRREERARIIKVLADNGVSVPLDIAYMLAGDKE